jgi:hypothetical protein
MPDSERPFPRQPPDSFTDRNSFLDCLLGVIGLCERTIAALAAEVDPQDPADPSSEEARPVPVAPILR